MERIVSRGVNRLAISRCSVERVVSSGSIQFLPISSLSSTSEPAEELSATVSIMPVDESASFPVASLSPGVSPGKTSRAAFVPWQSELAIKSGLATRP